MATQALGFPSLAGGGKWRETSDRLNPCGFADRQSRPWSAAGAGGFEVIERPPGVPFQKIQFGNERGGRSVLSRLPDLRIARILALLRCLILCLSVSPKEIIY